MNELFSTIVKWFADNGTASDWFTSFGTVGAVVTSLFLTLRQDKVKVAARIEKNRNNYYVIVHNKGKSSVYISNIIVQYRLKNEEYKTLDDNMLVNLEIIVYPKQLKRIGMNEKMHGLHLILQEEHSSQLKQDGFFFLNGWVAIDGQAYKIDETKIDWK